MYKDIAIIGMSGIFPMASNLEEFHEILLKGTDCIREMPESRKKLLGLPPEKKYQEIGYIDDIEFFDHQFFGIPSKKADNMSPEQKICLQMVVQTILDAGYSLESFKGKNCSVLVSSTDNTYGDMVENPNSFSCLGSLKPMLSGEIAYFLDLRGPNIMIDTACSASLTALHQGCIQLITEEVDYVLVGGISVYLSFSEENAERDLLGIESVRGRSRPFEATADGTGIGEGGGFVLLKRLDEAEKEGDSIIAIIKGSAINGDGSRCQSVTSPSIDGQKEVMLKAWERAGISGKYITEIEAHGTGTIMGDPIEATSISECLLQYGCKKKSVYLGGVKGNIGHLSYASGIASVIKVLCEFKHGIIYPIANFTCPNPFINFDELPLKPVDTPVYVERTKKRLVGINSFGLNGTNVHILLENYIREKNIYSYNEDEEFLLKVSGRTKEAFQKIGELIKTFLNNDEICIEDALYTLNVGRDDYQYRKLIKGRNRKEIIEQLEYINCASRLNQKRIVLLLFKCDDYYDWNIDSRYCKSIMSEEPEENEGDFLYQLYLYKYLIEMGINFDFIVADDFGYKLMEHVNGKCSLREVLLSQKHQSTSNQHKIKKKINLLNNESDILLINLSFCSVGIEGVNEYIPRNIHDLNNILIDAYENGSNLNWNRYYKTKKRRRISAPVYPFEKQYHWVELKKTEYIQEKNENEEIDFISNEVAFSNTLMDIWKDLLGKDVNEDSDFFEMGGNSLLITILVEEIKKAFKIKVKNSLVYTYSVFGNMKMEIYRLLQAKKTETQKLRSDIKNLQVDSNDVDLYEENTFPLSSMQKTIWITQKKYPNRGNWNLSLPIRVEGKLDISKLKLAVKQMCDRHEILRSIILKINNDLRWKSYEQYPLKFNIVNINSETSMDEKEESIRNIIKKKTMEPFSMIENILFETDVYDTGENVTYLLFKMHHILSDGWSLSLIFDEICRFYNGQNISEKAVSFRKYVSSEIDFLYSEEGRTQKQFWKSVSDKWVFYKLPKKRDLDIGEDIINIEFMLADRSLTQMLRKISQHYKVSIFNIYLLAYHLTIRKMLDTKVTCVGVMTANREDSAFKHIVGLLTRALPTVLEIDDTKPLLKYLYEIREITLSALDNQKISISEILDDGMYQKTFDELVKFLLVFQNFGDIKMDISDLKLSSCITNKRSALCPIAMIVYEDKNVVISNIEYDPSYFDIDEVSSFISIFQGYLKTIALADENILISDLLEAKDERKN